MAKRKGKTVGRNVKANDELPHTASPQARLEHRHTQFEAECFRAVIDPHNFVFKVSEAEERFYRKCRAKSRARDAILDETGRTWNVLFEFLRRWGPAAIGLDPLGVAQAGFKITIPDSVTTPERLTISEAWRAIWNGRAMMRALADNDIVTAVRCALSFAACSRNAGYQVQMPFARRGRASTEGGKLGGRKKRYTPEKREELRAKYQPVVDEIAAKPEAENYNWTTLSDKAGLRLKCSGKTVRTYCKDPRDC
jgi:hypothetical protein